MQLTLYQNYLNSEDIKMLTLKQLNLSEEELTEMLSFIFENSDNPEKEFYLRFVKEATLEQKMILMMTEASPEYKTKHIKKGVMSGLGALFGPFWIAKRAIQAFYDKCSRKCSIGGLNTFMRQKCMAECQVGQADRRMAAAQKISCAGNKECEDKKKGLIQKYKEQAAKARNKHLAYKEKHKDVRFTV
jgi:hypothetical protein